MTSTPPRRPAESASARSGSRRSGAHAPRRAPFAVLVAAVLGGGLILLLGLNTASAANELRRHDLAARDEGVAASIVALRNAVAASAAPQNLAVHAAQYGMVPAANPAFLVVGKAGAVRVLGSPAAASSVPLPAPTTPSPVSKTKHAPTRQHGKKAKATKNAKADKTASSSPAAASTSATKQASSDHHRATPSPAPSPTPAQPSPPPAPAITLPGGTR